MTQEAQKAAPNAVLHPVFYVTVGVPAFVGYKIVEGASLEAGMATWPSIGLASLGGLVGASLGGLIISLILRRRNSPTGQQAGR